MMLPKVSRLPNGHTRVELNIDGECVSWLKIVPMTIRAGSAQIRMDGIADVGTREEHRMKGCSRCVLNAAIDHMTGGDAAVSMLYGISNFYHKFGYATSGPEHYILFTNLDDDVPADWTSRPFSLEDLGDVRSIYDTATSAATGTAIRHPESEVWSKLATSIESSDDACHVIVGSDGIAHAYVWLAHWCYSVEKLRRQFSDALIIGEAVADSPIAADALLAACKQLAIDRNVKRVLLASPPDCHVANAAMRQDSRFISDFDACGGSMIRVLDVKRLLDSLVPEIKVHLENINPAYTGTLTFNTDIGNAAIVIEHDDVIVQDAKPNPDNPVIEIPQAELGRLALGVFTPTDIMERLASPPDTNTSKLVQQLFPLRHPHMYLPDRF
ncbi:MAG: GNAT family N-acetyltransferase [Armatimonadota bacterium]